MRHRLPSLCLLAVLAWVSTAVAQLNSNVPSANQGQFEPPGKLEITKHQLVLESPPAPAQKSIDPVKMRNEATELSDLAHSISLDTDQILQGKLPKDYADKLKRIEKLSKHLRNEVSP